MCSCLQMARSLPSSVDTAPGSKGGQAPAEVLGGEAEQSTGTRRKDGAQPRAGLPGTQQRTCAEQDCASSINAYGAQE